MSIYIFFLFSCSDAEATSHLRGENQYIYLKNEKILEKSNTNMHFILYILIYNILIIYIYISICMSTAPHDVINAGIVLGMSETQVRQVHKI